MIMFGNWDPGEEKRIKQMQKKLSELFNYIQTARNKSLAHNDLEAFARGDALGAFPLGMDVEYFDVLQQPVNMVSAKWLDSNIYPFNDLAAADVKQFLYILNRY
jgi:hypothetical protein